SIAETAASALHFMVYRAECHRGMELVGSRLASRSKSLGNSLASFPRQRESSSRSFSQKCSGNRELKAGGESGIRTHGRVSPTHAFQACSFNHSDISPFRVNDLRAVGRQIIARRRRIPSVSRSYYDSAVYERA